MRNKASRKSWWMLNTLLTHTQPCTSFFVGTDICITQLLNQPPTMTTNHLNLPHNINPNLISILKPGLNPQTGLWSCEDQPKCPHFLKISPLCHYFGTQHIASIRTETETHSFLVSSSYSGPKHLSLERDALLFDWCVPRLGPKLLPK